MKRKKANTIPMTTRKKTTNFLYNQSTVIPVGGFLVGDFGNYGR
jgi:hypothetical protein